MKTIVVGLGNPILGDDGVGWKVAEEVERLFTSDDAHQERHVVFEYCSLGGLSLMENLIGYDEAILIDALVLDGAPGTVSTFPLTELPNFSAEHTTSAHDTSLQDALKMGYSMGFSLPKQIMIVGITARQLYDFSEVLSADVAASVPVAAQAVMDLLANDR